MAQLGERDLALLSALMYCDAVVNYEGERLSKLVLKLLKDTKDNKLNGLKLYGEFIYIKNEEGEVICTPKVSNFWGAYHFSCPVGFRAQILKEKQKWF